MGQKKDKRFVIQEHKTPTEVHWDLMLEVGDKLRTYRLTVGPESLLDTVTVDAERIDDHSLRFLTYQGPVQKGTGSIRIVESGSYVLINQTKTSLELKLISQILKGKSVLTHIKNNNWLLTYEPESGSS